MSTLSLTLKIGSSIAVVSAGATTTYFLWPQRNNLNQKIVVFAESTTLNASDSEINNISSYKCHLEGVETIKAQECLIKEVSVSEFTNKHVNLTEIKNVKKSDPTINNLKDANKIFSIELPVNFFGADGQNSLKKIEVINGSKNKIASLNPLFQHLGSDVFGKTSYAIGKVIDFVLFNEKIAASISNDSLKISSTDTKCLFLKDSKPEGGIACSIYKFTSSKQTGNKPLNQIEFATDNDKQTQIDKDNYYLFKFDSPIKKSFDELKTNGMVKVSINPDSSFGPSIGTYLQVEKLIPVALTSESVPKLAFLINNGN